MAEKLKLAYTVLGVACFSAFLVGKCMTSKDCNQEEPKKQLEEKQKEVPKPKPDRDIEKLRNDKVLTRLAYLKTSRTMAKKMKNKKKPGIMKRC